MPKPTPILAVPRLGVALVLALLAGEAPASVCDASLVLGWEDAPPYQYRTEGGSVDGFDVATVTAVFERMGCDLELREVPWERHKAELRQGTVDMAAGIAKVGDREEWLWYSAPYRFDETSLWVLAEDLEELDFERIPEVAGTDLVFGHRRGYSHGGSFQELLDTPGGEARLQAVDSDEQNVEKLLRGRIDGFFGEQATIRPLLRRMDLAERIVPHPAEVYSGHSYVVFSKGSVDREVVEAFDAALAALREDGTYAELHAKHLE